MRISWLEPSIVEQTKQALQAHKDTWDAFFTPEFRAPPAPMGFQIKEWSHVAEHVARAERVSVIIRRDGLEHAIKTFFRSPHAIEQATLVSAANQANALTMELLENLFSSNVDDLIVYGTFLHLLTAQGADDLPRTLAVYERFCATIQITKSNHPMWQDRVAAVRDGLASFYVTCGRYEQAHALFRERHDEQTPDLLVSLGASRAFLSANATGRAIQWLLLAADRAMNLGRTSTANTLRRKAATLRKRLS